MGKKRTIRGSERTIILRIFHFFEEEKLRGITIPITAVDKRVCAATGVSRHTLTRIKREEENEIAKRRRLEVESEPQPSTSSEAPTESVKLSTPGKKRIQKKKLEIDDMCYQNQNLILLYRSQRSANIEKTISGCQKRP
ncbi:unnamed protein product [Parnassius apollo]|uniref:(apollo) hypothetical protein n=1 Tax=Parnassius apollo TaxID=110799 RepID=A0A8S3WBM5_PARAO|nr:unnamed protein product [Parnassius apollo]